KYLSMHFFYILLLHILTIASIKIRTISNIVSLPLSSAKSDQQVKNSPLTMAQSEYIYTNDTPVVQLDACTAFQNLTTEEKLYAHHLSKASWFGSLVVLFQTSPESPLIFALFKRLFGGQNLAELKSVALKNASMSEDEWRAFLVYVSAFYSNMGNYRGFGDSKFIPNFPKEKFETLIKHSTAYGQDPGFFDFVWKNVQNRLYSLETSQLSLGFEPKGTTTYFSSNMTEADSKIVKKFLQVNHIDAYNTRALKDEKEYIVRFASILETSDTTDRDYMNNITNFTVDGHKFRLERGDYSPILKILNKYLEQAQKTTRNSTEVSMIGEYIKHFKSGSLDAHKQGSRFWIKNKGPIVETYIGFIENYRDPAGQRAEFEGFVAVVNKEMSKKFLSLVNGAASFLPKLPWSKEFEKDHFSQPDFTSLDVLTFTGSGIPAGINIPNYDEIRQNEGFKNVSLGNVITASLKETKPNFLSAEDAKILDKYSVASFEVQVGLHELLGHGSGKLLRAEKDGKLNFDPSKTINPLTGKPVSLWYAANESYDSKFGSLSSAYEECRAECVGLYLSLDSDVLKIFGFSDPEEQKNIIYANWLSMVHKGIESLKMYNPSVKKWLQAHSHARYVITRVLLEASKDLVRIDQIEKSADDGKPDLLISFTKDPVKIQTIGKKAIGDFLIKLQTYKSTGDSQAAIKMFEKYSIVGDDLEYPYLKFREVSISRKKPRRLFVESVTQLNGSTVQLKTFEQTHEGLIQSFQEHFANEPNIENMLVELWKKDSMYFF
ncbi:bifunctional diacylglycerol diphosphate phosphatase/phosphatidate phosphatase, partial [Blomia tropicalis]